MTGASVRRERLPPDVRRALEDARGLEPDAPLVVARAPGRLDVMGGIADYSGSEVLQMPIREAAIVLLQRTREPVLDIESAGGAETGRSDRVRHALGDLLPPAVSLDGARAALARRPADAWAGYVAGVFPLLADAGRRIDGGARLLVRSDVPEGKGVSSSAALEVATMRAVDAAWSLSLDACETALLCQRVENELVGAPCGLMDQMTSSAGAAGCLLSMLCQPDRLMPDVAIPSSLAVFGIDSGIRHAVGGADYGAVRTAAFVGYRLLLERAGIADATVAAADVVDRRWGGYLANVTPSELDAGLLEALPARLRGADFLARFDATTDTVTRVDPARDYAVRAASVHPVHEHVRVRLFRHLLQGWHECESPRDDAGVTLGELMYASHASYSACGLGSDGTDRLVALAREAGAAAGVLGARITGGGSGGTVAILARHDAGAAVEAIAERYRARSGHAARLFDGSSDGARVWRLETPGATLATPVPTPRDGR